MYSGIRIRKRAESLHTFIIKFCLLFKLFQEYDHFDFPVKSKVLFKTLIF